MSDHAAVAEPVHEEAERTERPKPKRLPPYAVVVLNDDDHTFPYVIETFMKVFGYTQTKSFLLASDIHVHGRAAVWTGPKEVAELKRDQIRSAGPDLFAASKVTYPLGVVLEARPG
ncbi:MAG TPA: ATP-dependent Clp protease adaptor ClpS [Pirellulales bacterium]|nr:ATP-dependent Clp protease adaptor ClpS [Pirellulales bacterium]